VGNLKERDYLGDPGTDERIILKWIKKWDGEAWTKYIWWEIGTSGGLF